MSSPIPSLPRVNSPRRAPGTNVDPPSSRPVQNKTCPARPAPDHSQLSPETKATPESTGTRTAASCHHGTASTSRESVTSLGAQQSALMPAPPATRSNPRPCTRDLHTVHSHRLPGWSPPTLSMRTSDVDLRFHSESGAPRAARPRSRSLSGKPGGSTHSTASTPTPGQAQPDNPVLPTTREESATSSGRTLPDPTGSSHQDEKQESALAELYSIE